MPFPIKMSFHASLQTCPKGFSFLLKKEIKSRVDNLKRYSESPVLLNPMRSIDIKKQNFDFVMQQFLNSAENSRNRKKERFSLLAAKLDALSPLAVLGRGFCVSTDLNGKVITSIKNLKKDSDISVGMTDGHAKCRVLEIIEGKK